MVLTLDPQVPLVWRSPTTLQFGIDAAPVVLEEVSDATARLVATLSRGVAHRTLTVIGQSLGVGPAAVNDLLAEIADVVVDSSASQPSRWTIAVDGDGEPADAVARLLAACGHTVRVGDAECLADTVGIDLAVLTAAFAIPPDRYGAWLRRDVPHLPVVFGDRTVRIGPLVEPGAGPCLYCLDRTRTDDDPAWPAIAGQLLGRPAPAATPLQVADAATHAVRAALLRLDTGSSPLRASSLTLAIDGGVAMRRHLRHPECGCQALPENVTALDADRGARRSTRRSRPDSALA